MENHHDFHGKIHYSTGSFSIAMLLNYQRVTTTLLGDFETFIQAAAWIRKILVNHSPVRHLNTHVFHMFGPLVPRFSIFLSCDPFFLRKTTLKWRKLAKQWHTWATMDMQSRRDISYNDLTSWRHKATATFSGWFFHGIQWNPMDFVAFVKHLKTCLWSTARLI
jgi:hypothetical protein